MHARLRQRIGSMWAVSISNLAELPLLANVPGTSGAHLMAFAARLAAPKAPLLDVRRRSNFVSSSSAEHFLN